MAVPARARVALALLGLLVVTAAALGVAGAAAALAGPQPSMLVLRLHDLPAGMQIGDDSGCGPMDPEGASAEVAEWILANRPEGCEFQYQRVFAVAGPGVVPPLVESDAIRVGEEAGATAGLAIAPGLASARTGHHTVPREARAPAIGAQARLFHSHDVGVNGRSRGNGTFLYWRQGDVLASLLVAGGAPAVNDRVAARLARVQQDHIESPTPYTAAEQDDTEVPLDNPRLGYPVPWLGRTFAPGHGLPATTLAEAWAGNGTVGPPGEKARLEYDRLALSIFTRGSWKRYLRSPLADLVAGWHCTKRTSISVPGGSAIIYGGYRKDFDRCPSRRPDVWTGRVFLGSTVVTIDAPVCLPCVAASVGPYGSMRGMTAVARGLRLRRQPRLSSRLP